MQVHMRKKLPKKKKKRKVTAKRSQTDRCCSNRVLWDTVALPSCAVTPVAPSRYVSAVSDPAHTMSFRVANTVAARKQINGACGGCTPPAWTSGQTLRDTAFG